MFRSLIHSIWVQINDSSLLNNQETQEALLVFMTMEEEVGYTKAVVFFLNTTISKLEVADIQGLGDELHELWISQIKKVKIILTRQGWVITRLGHQELSWQTQIGNRLNFKDHMNWVQAQETSPKAHIAFLLNSQLVSALSITEVLNSVLQLVVVFITSKVMREKNEGNLKGRKINTKTNVRRGQDPQILHQVLVVKSPAQAPARQEVHHQER